ncbi:cupin [Metabacillus arenae]|uniref:Cupin n=1 Tax=Metabacillus arenae TaxID=2771434 RepID=A0A926NE75_9BACI|nr:cupin [Metabacillus arenae]MBD1379854.1 cupin [Metabacillus arenae]
MEIYRFDKAVGKPINLFSSNFSLMPIIKQEMKHIHIACMQLETEGVIGFHEAATNQLLLVIQGEGWVRGEAEQRIKIQAGEAAFWRQGEGHETTTKEGLTAIVIEGEDLNPEQMTRK